MSRTRALAAAGAGALAAAAVAPATASAHGLVGKQDLPIPRVLFAWAAAIVLVVSFIALGALWKRARWEGGVEERELLRFPRWLEVPCGVLGVALFALAVYAGLDGTTEATSNLLPNLIYVLFWVGFPFASALFGDIFRPFNPWLAIGRATGWLVRKVGGDAVPEPLPYPERLGRWPAVAGIVGFAWLELVYVDKDNTVTLAYLSLGYCAVQLVAMSIWGADRWSRRGDSFGVYFNLIARLSPLHWRDGRLYWRVPLAGVTGLNAVPGTVALVCVLIGSTSFDGFSQGQIWNGTNGGAGLAGHLQDFFTSLGLSLQSALEAAFTVGLLAMIGLIAGLYRLGVNGMSDIGEKYPASDLARRFVHSLVPIALAYVVAHYFSLLVYQGQATAYLISDPLGNGHDYFGTANVGIDYSVISATQVWYVQVVALVAGHVSGLILAHDRAIAVYSNPKAATRSQYWMLTVMVAFTCLGLYLLSESA
ncbi:MAG TPA: fenitrothion hydrolase [Solirubrobacteraceae bacterium]